MESEKAPTDNAKLPRFSGGMRHYHRALSPAAAAAKAGKQNGKKAAFWFKIIGISLAILALAGIITGLVVELSA